MKKIISILCIFVLSAAVLCACGKKKEPETQPQTTEAQTEKLTEAPTEPATTKEPLDNNALVEKVFKDLRLSPAYAADINVSEMDEDGSVTVSFKLNNYDCYYVLNGMTGNILIRNVPSEAYGEPENAMDPFEKAVNTALGTLEGYSGGAQNIQADMTDGIIEVSFDWNDNHYTFHYDVNQEKLID